MDRSETVFHDLAVDILARTLWGEARGEGVAGMRAVAHVVLNRVRLAQAGAVRWWGDDIVGVCRKPYQFSCWNRTDPNRPRVLAVSGRDPVFATALHIARDVLERGGPDPTFGATHYHAQGVVPYWARGHAPVSVIGRHLFYRLIEELED